MNSASEKVLAALEAAGKAATPGPWAQWPNSKDCIYAKINGSKETLATFDDDISVGTGDEDEDTADEMGHDAAKANASATVAAVNLASPLAAVARAAMAYHEDGYLGADGMQHHTTYACARLRAALDALEAAAEGVA